MSKLKTGDVCIITKRIWGSFWERGEPDYIGIKVKIKGPSGLNEDGENTYTVQFLTDRTFTNGNGNGRTYSASSPPPSTIQESALRKRMPGFGDWISKIEKATWKATKL